MANRIPRVGEQLVINGEMWVVVGHSTIQREVEVVEHDQDVLREVEYLAIDIYGGRDGDCRQIEIPERYVVIHAVTIYRDPDYNNDPIEYVDYREDAE